MKNILKKIFKEDQVEVMPMNYNLITYKLDDKFKYEIFTKDKYIEYRLNKLDGMDIKKARKGIEESWDRIRKGYNFIIGVGKKTDLMFYSIEYFNNSVIGK